MKSLTKWTCRIGLAAGLLAGLGSVAALAADVHTDFDHNIDFSKYHTYSWGKVTTATPFYQDRIKKAVDSELQRNGWQLVTSGAQTTIFATDKVHTERDMETTYNNFGGGWGGGWGWGGWGGMGGWGDMGGMGESTTTPVDQRVGKLVLDVFDSSSKTLLWRGSVTDDLSNNSSKNTKEMQKDVAKMLKDFPPKPTK